MEPIETWKLRSDFSAVYSDTIRRDGASSMLCWLDYNGFFEATASSKHHLAQPGGLVIHSLNVWRRLREITVRDMTDRNAPGVRHLSEAEEETVAILGLLHDVCKITCAECGRRRFGIPYDVTGWPTCRKKEDKPK